MPSAVDTVTLAVVLVCGASVLLLNRIGRLRRVYPGRVAWPVVAFVAVLASGVSRALIDAVWGPIVVIACGAVLLWANRSRLPHPVQAVALVFSVVAVVLNAVGTLARGGTPVVGSSAEAAGFSSADELGPGYVWINRPTTLDRLTGDSIAVPAFDAVVSVGDLLLLVGFPLLLGWFLTDALDPVEQTSPDVARERGSG